MITHRNESVWLNPKSFDKICGPRSPITTKYVMQEPNKNPIEHSSIISLPDEPKIYEPVERRALSTERMYWYAKQNAYIPSNSKVFRLVLIEDFKR